MTDQNIYERFPVLQNERRQKIGEQVANLALLSGEITDEFTEVSRIPRKRNGERENDVEHTYMLTVAAVEIAHNLELDLDMNKVRAFCTVHDLLELRVKDVATFNLTPVQAAEKERLEKEALEELSTELTPVLAADLIEYERQDTREAVFVRMVDKLMPVAVDTTGDGVRIMQEDYGINSYEELIESHQELHTKIAEKFGREHPDLVAAHAQLCLIFEAKYLETAKTTAVVEKQRKPTEIELKYLVNLDKLPNDINLSKVENIRINQGYFPVEEDGSETRIRNSNNEKFELTTKSSGMIARNEQTIKLTKEMFEALWPQTTGRQVTKTRYKIPLGEVVAELDIYEDHLEGLATVEVEFDGRPAEALIRATTFEPPEWFVQNVSEDRRYKNHSLAEQMPHGPVPLGQTHL